MYIFRKLEIELRMNVQLADALNLGAIGVKTEDQDSRIELITSSGDTPGMERKSKSTRRTKSSVQSQRALPGELTPLESVKRNGMDTITPNLQGEISVSLSNLSLKDLIERNDENLPQPIRKRSKRRERKMIDIGAASEAVMQEEKSVSRGRRSEREGKKLKKSKEDSSPVTFTPSSMLFKSIRKNPLEFAEKVTSVHIQRADSLIPELYLQHPIVQIHILDALTGLYLRKTTLSRRVASLRGEPTDISHILPAVTKPFVLSSSLTGCPHWDQEIIFNEKYLHVVQSDVVIMFEILDFVTSSTAMKKYFPIYTRYPDGWNRVAWGFLRLVSDNGEANTEINARLQLFKYPWHLFPQPSDESVPYVYRCWKETWRKYPSTIYIKVSAHVPIEEAALTNHSEGIEDGSNIQNLLGQTHNETNRASAPMRNFVSLHNLKPKWRRKADEVCKLPNKLLYRINTGSKGSFSCAFSNSGLLLAVAGVSNTAYPIRIYQLDTGERLATLDGHQDLVYQLVWSENDSQLISASSDGSVRVWEFTIDGNVRQSALLLHPAFVYTALFHPKIKRPRVIASGAYDGNIRFWRSEGKEVSYKSDAPLRILKGHQSNVNSLCFSSDGSRLYSGDADGLLKVWSSVGKGEELQYDCIKTIDALKGRPIQALRIHPSNRKLLVQTLGPFLHTVDTRIHRILTQFELPSHKMQALHHSPTRARQPGQLSSIHQITSSKFLKCAFSPCGTFIFVGSTSGTVHFWKTDTGAYMGSYSTESLSCWSKVDVPIVDISFHPHDHIIAFSVWGDREPVRLYTYDASSPEMGLEEYKAFKHLDVDKIVRLSMSSGLNKIETPNA